MLVLSAVAGFFLYIDKDININSSSQCSIQQLQECSLINQGHKVSVKFKQHIELEEELNLEIKIPKQTQLHQVWVQGVNMYMGKTAVLIEASKNQEADRLYQSVLFLGACSEPHMKWQLVVQIKNSEQNIQSYFFNFETHY